jgi:hypothetical protein
VNKEIEEESEGQMFTAKQNSFRRKRRNKQAREE